MASPYEANPRLLEYIARSAQKSTCPALAAAPAELWGRFRRDRLARCAGLIILFIPCSLPTCAAPNDTCMPAANSILAEMMELGRLGRGGQRQVRALADRPPGVAHGGGDISLYPLLAPTCAAPNETCMPAANSILAEMMELGRLGRGGRRQVRGLADRPPGVAHGGGDTLYPLLAPTCAAPNEVKQGDC